MEPFPAITSRRPARRRGSDRPALPDALRAIAELMAPPDQALAAPGLQERIARIGGAVPRYPVGAPTRADVLTALRN